MPAHRGYSERESEPSDKRPRLQEMRSTERRKEVVKRDLIGEVGDLQGGSDFLALISVQQIIRTDAEIDHLARLDTSRIVIVVFQAGLRKREEFRGNPSVA